MKVIPSISLLDKNDLIRIRNDLYCPSDIRMIIDELLAENTSLERLIEISTNRWLYIKIYANHLILKRTLGDL